MDPKLKVFESHKYDHILTERTMEALSLIDSQSRLSQREYVLFPGFCDVHVHFREPGFSYKETIKTGSMAAAHGGYTSVCTMPNLKPVPDSIEHLNVEQEIIARDASIHVYPYGALTVGQLGSTLADLEGMAHNVIAFSDDGHGVQSDDIMRDAMLKAKSLNKVVAAHCEVNDLLHGGYIHAGNYAFIHDHRGICSESEWKQVERDINLAEETGAAYHVCHISCRESVELIRAAKKRGVDISCETAPHYLIFDDSNLCEDGRWKMNPPIRSSDDKQALIEGICDGTIDCIATDHAPHSYEEKSLGLKDSAFGISGIETAFPLMYTHFVRTGIISLNRLIDLLAHNPRKRFGIPSGDDFTVWDLNDSYRIDPQSFFSKGRSTPFEGMQVFGRCMLTSCGDRFAYKYLQ